MRNYQSGVLIPQDSLFTVQETEFKPQSPALLPQIDTSEIQPETFVMHPPKSATQALASFAQCAMGKLKDSFHDDKPTLFLK